MLNIYIARHGQDEDNSRGILNGHRDTPLTGLGVQQAQVLADTMYMNNLSFDAVYASPLQRAFRTAEIITKKLQMDVPEKLPLLIERDFGMMEGKFASDILLLCGEKILATSTITYFLEPEGAETFPDLMKRGRMVIDFLEARYTSGNILLVCHGDIGKMIFAEYCGLNWREVLTLFHFGNSDLILLDKGTPKNKSHVFQFPQHNH